MARQIQRYALFVTLLRLDSTLRPVPYFARRWTWSTDRRELTFYLASDLNWHDGPRTTARDVAFTIDAARDPAVAYYRQGDLRDIERVEAVNDSTALIRFWREQPRMPQVFSELPIVPAHVLSGVPRDAFRTGSFATSPVGNGPYRFVRRVPGQQWVFEQNLEFSPQLGGPPTIPRVVVAVVDEATTKFAGLVSGELDVAGIAPTMAGLTNADPLLRVVQYPVAFAYALVFNTTRPPFNDDRVRRAISAAIDRKRLIDVALAGYGMPAAGLLPPQHPFFDGASPQPVNGDSLLNSAGWRREASGTRRRNGLTLSMSLRTVGGGDNAVEQLLQDDLRDLGVAVEIQQMELGAFLVDARAQVKRFDALVTGIPGDVSLSHIGAMFESVQRGGPLDYAGYHHPELDSLFARARAASDDEQLAASWRVIDGWLAKRSPVAWLYHAQGVQGVRRRLQGVTMDLRGELVTLAQWRFAKANAR